MHKILYFAKVAEQLQHQQETIEQQFADLHELRQFLAQRGDIWHQVLFDENTQIAQNQRLCAWHEKLEANSEIAIFPPMTGG